jgi:chemotaxis protein CheX
MLQEQELKTFVEGTTNYFEVAAQQPASIGSPYLMEGTPAVHDYTGVINISGKREGVVYFTAPKAMLTVLLMKMQENDFSHETMRDLVGEVANTISGNARRDFGRDFVISVPSVLAGEKPDLKPGTRCFVIPINWRSHSAKLIVSLTRRPHFAHRYEVRAYIPFTPPRAADIPAPPR